jgi:enoyl-CoA hydratase
MTAPHNTPMTLASYQLNDGVATITMDDGKVNALSPKMLADVTAQLERAAADEVGVVLTGRARTFSAGFDVRCEQARWPEMVAAGAMLAERIMSFPAPVVVACNGNAIAMGAFLLLSADHRIGARGDFRIGLNEVAIGLTIPWFGIEIARHRLTPPYFDRCTITGALLGPDEATTAGFLDEVVAPDELASAAHAAALAFTSIDRGAHAANKLRVRQAAISGVRDGIDRVKSGNKEW